MGSRKDRIKLKIHPLFFGLGLYYALTGRILVFIIYTLSALIHEIGHSFSAYNLGYKLNKITLMPFGAVVSGNIEGIKPVDQMKVALSGPCINLIVGLTFIATWWLYPESYAYTDVAAEANLSIAIVNFLPVFPLDGGRILSSFLALKTGSEKAQKIAKILGIILASILLILFVLSCFFTVNVSLLFFSAFVFLGAIDKNKENRYVKIFACSLKDKLLKGVPYKKQAVHKDVTLKKLLNIVSVDEINEIVVFNDYKEIKTLNNNEIQEILKKGNIYSKLSEYI